MKGCFIDSDPNHSFPNTGQFRECVHANTGPVKSISSRVGVDVATGGSNPKLMSAGEVAIRCVDVQAKSIELMTQSFGVLYDAGRILPATTFLELLERNSQADRRRKVVAADHFVLRLIDPFPKI